MAFGHFPVAEALHPALCKNLTAFGRKLVQGRHHRRHALLGIQRLVGTRLVMDPLGADAVGGCIDPVGVPHATPPRGARVFVGEVVGGSIDEAARIIDSVGKLGLAKPDKQLLINILGDGFMAQARGQEAQKLGAHLQIDRQQLVEDRVRHVTVVADELCAVIYRDFVRETKP